MGETLDEKLAAIRRHAFDEGYYTAKAEIGKALLANGEHKQAIGLLLPMKPISNPYSPTPGSKEKS